MISQITHYSSNRNNSTRQGLFEVLILDAEHLLSESQVVARELADRGATHELHVALNLCAEQAEGPLDAGLAGRGHGR